MTKQILEQLLAHQAYFGGGGEDLNKSIPMSFLLLLVNRRLVVRNQYNKETYIKAHLTRLIDGRAAENGRGRDIHGLMNKHGGTKGYRSDTVLFSGSIYIRKRAGSPVGNNGNGSPTNRRRGPGVSSLCKPSLCDTSPAACTRARPVVPGESWQGKQKRKVGIKTRRVNPKPSVCFRQS